MAESENEQRPCLHCRMVELIDDFLAENPTTAGSDKVDTSEAIEVLKAAVLVLSGCGGRSHSKHRQLLPYASKLR